MTRGQRLALAITTALVGITRWLALSRTLWDWDEAQFILGLRHFDVAAHHPHPPGFPLFIAMGKLVQFAGVDEFHALQTINFIAAVLIVPAMTMFALAAGAEFLVAIEAAVILAFFPNVWFFGGTALSDVPSMTAVVFAIALLLGRNTRALYGGAIVAGIAAGMRPQNLLIVAVPFLIAMWRHRRRAIAPAAITAAIVVASYAGAAYASGGWSVFLEAVRNHQRYLAQFDAWTSPTRPPLTHLIDDFFFRPYHAQIINLITSGLAVVAVIRHRRHVLIAFGAFLPFCLAAWLMLDRFSTSRFSIGYAPLYAMLAADAFAHFRPRLQASLCAVYVALMVVWTWPALWVAHTTVSPPVAAAEWLQKNTRGVVYVHPSMGPFADALLPQRIRRNGVWSAAPGDWIIAERPGAVTFTRPHGRLWKLARQRYFVVSDSPAGSPFRFKDGWYGQESNGAEVWRWMGQRSRTEIAAPCTTLSLDVFVPQRDATITIAIDGVVVDRVPGTTEFPRTYRVHAPRELTVETDRVAHNGSDVRDLGLRLNGLECR